jgi:hypothetical protein
MRSCMSRKLGTIWRTISPMETPSTGTTASTSHDRPMSSRAAMMMPPTIMIGADTSRVPAISTSICTCCTSLVSRVMSEGAPKCCTSRAEKVPTRWKIAARRSRPKPIALRAENHTAITEQMICTNETASISPPWRTM